MPRILYPILTEPVLPPGLQPEQVTESRWHQPLSEPVRLRALPVAVVVAGLFWTPFTPAPRADTWLPPLSQPTLRSGLTTALISSSGETWAPTLPSLSLLWQQPLSQPTVRLATQQTPPAFVYAPAAASETITLDKWYQPLSGPEYSIGLPTPEQPYLSFVKAGPFPETVTADRWFQPLSQPLARGAAPFVAEIGPVFVSASVEWFQPLSIPRARAPSQYQALSYGYFVASAAPETITLDKWYEPLSIPVRYQRSADYPALTYSYAIVSAPPPPTDEPKYLLTLGVH